MMNDKTSVSWRFPFAFQAALGMLTSAMLVFMPECTYLGQEGHSFHPFSPC